MTLSELVLTAELQADSSVEMLQLLPRGGAAVLASCCILLHKPFGEGSASESCMHHGAGLPGCNSATAFTIPHLQRKMPRALANSGILNHSYFITSMLNQGCSAPPRAVLRSRKERLGKRWSEKKYPVGTI